MRPSISPPGLMRTSIAPSALIASDCEALAVGCGVQRMLVV